MILVSLQEPRRSGTEVLCVICVLYEGSHSGACAVS